MTHCFLHPTRDLRRVFSRADPLFRTRILLALLSSGRAHTAGCNGVGVSIGEPPLGTEIPRGVPQARRGNVVAKVNYSGRHGFFAMTGGRGAWPIAEIEEFWVLLSCP